MEKWKVFYHGEKELCAYTIRGSFQGEEEATIKSLAIENGIDVADIVVKIEERES